MGDLETAFFLKIEHLQKYENSFFTGHLLGTASETRMILILFLKFGKFELCHS